MSVLQKLKSATVPSIYSAGASVGLYYLLIDNDLTHSSYLGGIEVPTFVSVGAASFLGSELGELATEFIAPKIPVISEFVSEENAIIPALFSGLSTYGVMSLLSGDGGVPLTEALIIGSGGNFVGKTLYNSMMKY